MKDLDELIKTIEKIERIKNSLGVSNNTIVSPAKSENIFNECIGRYVICRTRNEGINAGKVVYAEKGVCVLEDARRIYYHKPKDKSVACMKA